MAHLADPGPSDAGGPVLVAVEYVVADLDRAIELLVDLLGIPELDRRRHPTLDADQVLLDAGPVVISLLHPTAHGDRPAILEPASNPVQLTFTVDGVAAVADLAGVLSEGGASVTIDSPTTFHLSAQATESIFGPAPSLVVTAVEPLPGG